MQYFMIFCIHTIYYFICTLYPLGLLFNSWSWSTWSQQSTLDKWWRALPSYDWFLGPWDDANGNMCHDWSGMWRYPGQYFMWWTIDSRRRNNYVSNPAEPVSQIYYMSNDYNDDLHFNCSNLILLILYVIIMTHLHDLYIY